MKRRSLFARLTAAAVAGRRAFSYEAAESSSRLRRTAAPNLRHEDAELPPEARRRLVAESRDLLRNYALAGWMIRRHLDYVATFEFQSKTGDRALDRRIESLWTAWATDPDAVDAAAKFSLSDFIRTAEACRVVDGDVGILRLGDGRLQAIESDRIRTPPGGIRNDNPDGPRPIWTHGVKTDDAGRPIAYAICRRARPDDLAPGAQSWTLERIVSAERLTLFGYYPRFDCTRGISPLAPALADLRDLAEAKAYSLAKMKVSQLFGLALYRNNSDPLGPATVADDAGDALAVDFGRGPYQLDLDAGDKAEILESHSPAGEFQTWFSTVTASALKALDIPFSFHSENFTNFSGARQAWIQYDLAARQKRRAVEMVLHNLTAWKLADWTAAGLLPALPPGRPWRWIATGVPWIDPLREVQADIQALQGQLTSRTRILAAQGEDWEEIVDELAREKATLEAAGLSSQIGYQTPVNNDPAAPDNIPPTVNTP